MKIFKCSVCGQVLFFENVACTKCGHSLAYLPDQRVVSAIEPVPDQPDLYRALLEDGEPHLYRLCENSRLHNVCNWAIPEGDPNPLCRSCRLNNIIPNLSAAEAKAAWARLEREKRHLLFSLDQLGLRILDDLKDGGICITDDFFLFRRDPVAVL